MQLKKLEATSKSISWPKDSNDLPIINWEEYQRQHKQSGRKLVAIGGFIHDVSDFLEEHPGGRHLLVKMIGKDATTAFFGGVYDHSNAAHNVRTFSLPFPHFSLPPPFSPTSLSISLPFLQNTNPLYSSSR